MDGKKKKEGKQKGKGPRPQVEDPRFSGAMNNPIFKPVPKTQKKVTIDKRFQSMFKDDKFKLTYKVDKRGRPIGGSTDENLRKYYNLEDEDEDAEVKEESSSESSEEEARIELKEGEKKGKLSEDVRKKLRSQKVDYARGEGILVSEESSEDDSSEEDESVGDEEDLEHEWGELDKNAETTEESTRRLALCNMDWDRIKAVDLMVLFTSFLPPGGTLQKVMIYPSEFGKKRMAEEDLKGPLEFAQFKQEVKDEDDEDSRNGGSDEEGNQSDDDEGSRYHREKMRQYQLNRLKYYYAVLEFNTVEAAETVYQECDGREYESSAAKIDLRYIPEDMEFDEAPKDECTSVPESNKYRPKFFTTTALQQVKVDCTWDETDPTRKELISRFADPKEKIDEDDLRAYLASSSSDSEVEDEDVDKDKDSTDDPIAKYRMLLESIEKKEEEGKKKDVELEISWGVGLKQKAEELVKKKAKEEEKKKLTPWEEQLEKRKDKRRLKKKGGSDVKGDSGSESDQPFSDDDVDVDMNDPFFKELKDAKVKKKDTKPHKTTAEDESRTGELDLLLLDEDDQKSHFNFKKIVADESETKSKKKRILKKNKKRGIVAEKEDDFNVNTEDARFSALFTSHHFNIDPSEPSFKKTKGMETIIQAKQKQRLAVPKDEAEILDKNDGQPLPRKTRPELSFLVNSIKNKTKAVNDKKGTSSRKKAKLR